MNGPIGVNKTAEFTVTDAQCTCAVHRRGHDPYCALLEHRRMGSPAVIASCGGVTFLFPPNTDAVFAEHVRTELWQRIEQLFASRP
jgi:hypothetical protein